MCEHCRSGKMWKEDKEEDVCEWSNPEPLEDEDELPPMCLNPASGGSIAEGVKGHPHAPSLEVRHVNAPLLDNRFHPARLRVIP